MRAAASRDASALVEEMQQIRAAVEPDNIVFILDATQGQAVHEQAVERRKPVERLSERQTVRDI